MPVTVMLGPFRFGCADVRLDWMTAGGEIMSVALADHAGLFVREIPASAPGTGAGDGPQGEAGDRCGEWSRPALIAARCAPRVSTIRLMSLPTMASMLRPKSVIADAETN
jgi:hypothetical protein